MLVLRLKEIAEKKNLNRHQLSMKTGISYPTISKYWEGKAVGRDFAILNKLCELLDVEPGDIIQRVVTTGSPP
jgi:DNA-binding Xre family transcriptional regulator